MRQVSTPLINGTEVQGRVKSTNDSDITGSANLDERSPALAQEGQGRVLCATQGSAPAPRLHLPRTAPTHQHQHQEQVRPPHQRLLALVICTFSQGPITRPSPSLSTRHVYPDTPPALSMTCTGRWTPLENARATGPPPPQAQ